MSSSTLTGKMFAVVAGDYGGSYLVIIDHIDSELRCLRLPQQTQMYISEVDFNRGVGSKIVNEVASIDKSVYNYCKHIYEKISNN